MIFTEAEAETKWCPWARSGDPGPPVDGGYVNRGSCCLASGCAQWRWAEGDTELFRSELSYPKADPEGYAPDAGAPLWLPPGDGWVVVDLDDGGARLWKRPRAARRGYCGLSGKPEFLGG